jgi:hypothetical protein
MICSRLSLFYKERKDVASLLLPSACCNSFCADCSIMKLDTKAVALEALTTPVLKSHLSTSVCRFDM